MIITRFASCILLALVFSCSRPVSHRPITVNESAVNSIYKNRPLLFISCIKCGCFVDLLSKPGERLLAVLTRYDIMADTTCVRKERFSFPVYHIPQSKIDSIYEENYNLVIVNKKGISTEARLIETEGSRRLDKILNGFLR